MRIISFVAAISAVISAVPAQAVAFPPGTFSVDGHAVTCANATFVLDDTLPDIGMEGYNLIFLNPGEMAPLPTALRLWWVGHECGHRMVGTDESAADCWSVQTGRAEGWFPPETFDLLEEMFADNLGDDEHLPGPVRVSRMRACYYAEQRGSLVRASR